MKFSCCTGSRRNEVLAHPFLNGMDFLEVLQTQTVLHVHFIKELTPDILERKRVIIEGGERIKHIKVVETSIHPDEKNILIVRVHLAGDFSTYTLRLVDASEKAGEVTGTEKDYDPVLSSLDFSFKVLCSTDFDCKPLQTYIPNPGKEPEINYLAKDYASFRQLMLDRIALLAPSWKERHPADLGMTLVELLAYVGDYLSYQQDAIATEAYIGTARKRISVRRHARLVDYPMHDGSNARTWVHLEVDETLNGLLLQRLGNNCPNQFLTKTKDLPLVLTVGSQDYLKAMDEGVQVFELLHDVKLHSAHNQMNFYTWGHSDCWLPKGAVSATLDGHITSLEPGDDVLIIAEVHSPQTGSAADAAPAKRHPVRLRKLRHLEDPLGLPATGQPTDYTPIPLTAIEWDAADALPFPLCISKKDKEGQEIVISVVLGNNVLVDHGLTMPPEELEPVPDANLASEAMLNDSTSTGCPCSEPEASVIPLRFNPSIGHGPLTQAAPYRQAALSASASSHWQMQDVLPAISLRESAGATWLPRRDLLDGRPDDKLFVVEVESDGTAYLRFGDNKSGQKPAPGTVFQANYRIGNGNAGNVGANTLCHLVSDNPGITGAGDKILAIYNPLPAFGGVEQESISWVRQKAPYAFRRQERAVTAKDYEEASKRCALKIQRSTATFRWTGSWRTVFLTVDPLAEMEIGIDVEKEVRHCLERYRMAGHDLKVDSPRYTPLEVAMTVCVKGDYFSSDVKAALLDVFSNSALPDGQLGVFHPDNFTFGQPVYLSPLYARAQQVAGVDFVQITQFQRQHDRRVSGLETGKLLMSRLEIARLDNDPNFPERGVFKLTMRGGK